MKIQQASLTKRGFTLMELMVAMAITTIIVTVLVSITSIAIDTWNRSRSELRAARQAKAMVDTMARDLESLVTRSGNDAEWLSVKVDTQDTQNLSSNAARLVFFSAATDRYAGNIGITGVDNGGDVSCVGYNLYYKDPIKGGTASNQTFVLNRYLADPDVTFKNILGKTNKTTTLDSVFQQYESQMESEENFICENIFQFTVTFHVEVTPAGGGVSEHKLVTIRPSGGVEKFSIKGTGIETTPANADLQAGRVSAVGISLTVLSDFGVDLLRRTSSKATDAAWMAKNSYQYSKLIKLPGM